MNRNKLLVIFGVLFILIFIVFIFWIQTGLKGTPSDTKFNFQIGFLQKMEISDDEFLNEFVQPAILSFKNPIKNNIISFCSLNEISSKSKDALIAPILGMNYFRYNFMSKELYSIDDRLDDDEDYIKNLSTTPEFKQLISAVKKNDLSQKRNLIIEEIDGKSSFLINPNYTGTKKGVFKSVKLIKDHIRKQNYLFNDEKPINIKIYVDLNGPKSYNKPEEINNTHTNLTTVEEGGEEEEEEEGEEEEEENIVLFTGVTLGTDRKFSWDSEASTVKIRISIPTQDISITKSVVKNSIIPLSSKEKASIVQIDDSKIDLINIEYLDTRTNRYKKVKVESAVNGEIHCYNIFERQ